ncbi:tyrosine-protein kinase Tec [Pelomyxa schiedti]|nr:tyrosine-protein kinase Tec [Pelomyxa schiedti]
MAHNSGDATNSDKEKTLCQEQPQQQQKENNVNDDVIDDDDEEELIKSTSQKRQKRSAAISVPAAATRGGATESPNVLGVHDETSNACEEGHSNERPRRQGYGSPSDRAVSALSRSSCSPQSRSVSTSPSHSVGIYKTPPQSSASPGLLTPAPLDLRKSCCHISPLCTPPPMYRATSPECSTPGSQIQTAQTPTSPRAIAIPYNTPHVQHSVTPPPSPGPSPLSSPRTSPQQAPIPEQPSTSPPPSFPTVANFNEARRIIYEVLSQFHPEVRRAVLAPALKQLHIPAWDFLRSTPVLVSEPTQFMDLLVYLGLQNYHSQLIDANITWDNFHLITEDWVKRAGLPECVGKKIEDYNSSSKQLSGVVLVSEIKSGAFGTVWNGLWNGTRVAAKQLKFSEKHKDSECAALIQRESAVLCKLSHPNIVHFFGTCVIDGNHMLVMELCHGSLLQLLQSSSAHAASSQLGVSGTPASLNLGELELLRMCKDVAAGMEYLAHHNIIHRDLACRNCLYIQFANGEYCVKVSDMGQARFCTDEYWSTSNCFPKKWAALEVLLGDPSTKASDVWSFGVLMWEIFTRGSEPYEELTAEGVSLLEFLQQGERLSIPAHVPPAIAELMQLCWHSDPGTRPTFSKIHQTLLELCPTLWPAKGAGNGNGSGGAHNGDPPTNNSEELMKADSSDESSAYGHPRNF